MGSMRETALKAFDCLVLNKDKYPLGMGLSKICEELKASVCEKPSIYFGLKELAKQGIVLYGTNKTGREKLFTPIAGKDAGSAVFSDLRKRKRKDMSQIVDELEEARNKAKAAPRVFTDENIKDWMLRNVSSYKGYETLANAAAVKFNRYEYAIYGKVQHDTYPEWIREFAKRIVHPEHDMSTMKPF